MLIKFIFLADLEARKYLGHPISSLQYEKNQKGPFDKAIYPALENLKQSGQVMEEVIEYPSGIRGSQYSMTAPPQPITMDRATEAILAYTLRAYSQHNLTNLLDVVYDTEPMLEVESAPHGTPIPMQLVDNQMKVAHSGVDLERVLLAEFEVAQGKTVPWEQLRGELLGHSC